MEVGLDQKFKWVIEVNDISTVSDRFLSYLNSPNQSTETNIIQVKVKPNEFNPGDKVYLIYDNLITESTIHTVIKSLNQPINYKVQSGETIIDRLFTHELVFESIDSALIYLRQNVRIFKSNDTK